MSSHPGVRADYTFGDPASYGLKLSESEDASAYDQIKIQVAMEKGSTPKQLCKRKQMPGTA